MNVLGGLSLGLGVLESIMAFQDRKSAEAEQRKMQKLALSSLDAGLAQAKPMFMQGMQQMDAAAETLAGRHEKARNMLGASTAANEAATARLLAQGVANATQTLASSGMGGTTYAAQAASQAARQAASDATGRAAAFGQVQASQEAAFAGQEFTANMARAEARTNFANWLYGHGANKSNIFANTSIQAPQGSALLPMLAAAGGQAGGFGNLFGYETGANAGTETT
jgi:hypothetical protein